MEENKSLASGMTNDYSTSPVPEKQKKSFVNNAAVWFGFTVSISAFLTGGTVHSGENGPERENGGCFASAYSINKILSIDKIISAVTF